MQTRSITRRAGTPHDLEAYNSYADDTFEFKLPFKKRARFLNWDEDSDDDFEPSDDDEESSADSSYMEEDPHTLRRTSVIDYENSISHNKSTELPTWRNVYTRTEWKNHIKLLEKMLCENKFNVENMTLSEYNAVSNRLHNH